MIFSLKHYTSYVVHRMMLQGAGLVSVGQWSITREQLQCFKKAITITVFQEKSISVVHMLTKTTLFYLKKITWIIIAKKYLTVNS